MNADNYISIVSAILSVGSALYIFLYQRRQNSFNILEQSFDVLQRINEKALESSENSLAAVRSCNPDDKTTAEQARIIYFHYMRINRIFRAYEYVRGGYLSQELGDRIIEPHLGTLVSVLPILPSIMERGYPPDFREYLIGRVKQTRISSLIGESVD